MISIKQNIFRGLPKAFILALAILFQFNYCSAMKETKASKEVKSNIATKVLLSLNCGHKFYRDFLMELVRYQVEEENNFSYCCPICLKSFTDEDVKNIFEEHVFERWDYLRNLHIMKKDKNFFSCRTPNCCNGLFYFKGDSQIWTCDMCRHQYCLCCKKEGHTGSCEDYEMYLKRNSLQKYKVRELFKLGKIKRCLFCRIYTHCVNNNIDITCERCSAHWCWHCMKFHGYCMHRPPLGKDVSAQ